MNVLEKILEEIEERGNIQFSSYSKPLIAVDDVLKIIHSHMGDATDTDDTEEKIREHIAECLHRIDNIRSFVGSKKYTNNDEKCIRNIEVLKTSITALEEYLSSKKKNGNDGWIPVEDGLPEETEERYYPEMNVTTSYGTTTWGFYRVIDKQWYIYSKIHNEFIETKDKEVIAWQPLPKPYKPENRNNNTTKEYQQEVEHLLEEIKSENGYVRVSDLAKRFEEIDKELFKKSSWNLLQILSNINILIPKHFD